mmetsp:Transcript_38077/g.91384  ORF Transcript_38077/g.91384 Transcript_38077/m.91384 type:complete len:286 (+) Transcript_38077:47-904(+)
MRFPWLTVVVNARIISQHASHFVFDDVADDGQPSAPQGVAGPMSDEVVPGRQSGLLDPREFAIHGEAFAARSPHPEVTRVNPHSVVLASPDSEVPAGSEAITREELVATEEVTPLAAAKVETAEAHSLDLQARLLKEAWAGVGDVAIGNSGASSHRGSTVLSSARVTLRKAQRAGVDAAVGRPKTPTELANTMTRPKGWDQCLKYARFVKGQKVSGDEFVRSWTATCESALKAGHATERYRLMCTSLQGVLQPFAAQSDYSIDQLCDSVLAVFHDVTAVDVEQAR